MHLYNMTSDEMCTVIPHPIQQRRVSWKVALFDLFKDLNALLGMGTVVNYKSNLPYSHSLVLIPATLLTKQQTEQKDKNNSTGQNNGKRVGHNYRKNTC